MATLQIIEFSHIATNRNGSAVPMAVLPALAVQNITISGTSAQSATLNANTRFVRLIGDAAFRFVAGANPTAAATDQRHAADSGEYFGITPDLKIAAVTA